MAGSSSDAAKNIATAVALKAAGNAAFKEGRYQDAITAYHQIFMYVNGYSASSGLGTGGMPGQTTTPATPEEMAQIRELKLAHHCNLAMCHMKHGPKLQKARDNCTKALAIDPDNVKALFRRGKCYAQLNALDEAKMDLDRVLQLQPDNLDAKRELRALKSAFDRVRKREQKKFAGMFDRINDEDAKADVQTTHTEATADGAPPDLLAVSDAVSVGGADVQPIASDADIVCETAGSSLDDVGKPLEEPREFQPSGYINPCLSGHAMQPMVALSSPIASVDHNAPHYRSRRCPWRR